MNILDFDMQSLLSLTASLLGPLLCGTLMYWFLILVMRFILRRDVGSLGISDLLFVVILGDATLKQRERKRDLRRRWDAADRQARHL